MDEQKQEQEHVHEVSQEEREKLFAADEKAAQANTTPAPKFMIRLVNGQDINTLENLTKEDLAKMPEAEAVVTHAQRFGKTSGGISTDVYYAYLRLDPRVMVYIPLDVNQYGIIATLQHKRYVDNQFTYKVRERLIETKWDSGRSSYRLEVIFNDLVKVVRKITADDSFILNLKLRLGNGYLDKKYEPWVRLPYKGEDEEAAAKPEGSQPGESGVQQQVAPTDTPF